MKNEKDDTNLAASYDSVYEEELIDLKEIFFSFRRNRKITGIQVQELGSRLRDNQNYNLKREDDIRVS